MVFTGEEVASGLRVSANALSFAMELPAPTLDPPDGPCRASTALAARASTLRKPAPPGYSPLLAAPGATRRLNHCCCDG